MPPTEIKSDLHALRDSAHKVFDRLWDGSFKYRRDDGLRRRAVSRRMAYAWLAEQLGIPGEDCHFSRMNQTLLRRSIGLCRGTTPRDIGYWAQRSRRESMLLEEPRP